MLNDHLYIEGWGIKPILFSIGNIQISSYAFFVSLGLIVGIIFYYLEAKKQNKLSENGFFIAFGSVAGGIIGAKLLELIINFKFFFSNLSDPEIFLSGRTIVGGLIGGFIGAVLTKRHLGIKEKRGNLFAPGIAIGVAIGRTGCFLQGCCFGKPGDLPWAVDFGDGILRHPTQIYESLFMFLMFLYLLKIKDDKNIEPGQLFKILMLAYFSFRFLIEFIRVEQIAFWGLSTFQIISIGVIIYLLKDEIDKLILSIKFYARAQERK